MKTPPFNAKLPPVSEAPKTTAQLIAAFASQRLLPFESLSPDALAGRLILNEGSPFYAALRVSETDEGHYLRRALPAIRAAENKITIPEFVAAPVPNPGSDAAITTGCKCPALDNGHGWGAWGKEGQFWITQGCPLHDTGTFNASAPTAPMECHE